MWIPPAITGAIAVPRSIVVGAYSLPTMDNLILWFNTQTDVSFTPDGADFKYTVLDQGPVGAALTQNSGTSSEGSLNGLATIDATGSVGLNPFSIDTDSFVIFTVIGNITVNTNPFNFSSGDIEVLTTNQMAISLGTTSTSLNSLLPISVANWAIYTWEYDRGLIRLYQNGVLVGARIGNLRTINFRSSTQGTYSWSDKIVYANPGGTSLSEVHKNTLGQTLASRYGLPWTTIPVLSLPDYSLATTTGLELWFSAESRVYLGSNGLSGFMLDNSSTENHAEYSSGSAAFTSLNGYKAIHIDGRFDLQSATASGDAKVLILVARFNADSDVLAGSPNDIFIDVGSTSDTMRIFTGATGVTSDPLPVRATNWAIYVWRLAQTGNDVAMYQNGFEVFNGTAGFQGRTYSRIGNVDFEFTDYIVYSTASVATINSICNLFASRYALPWTNIP